MMAQFGVYYFLFVAFTSLAWGKDLLWNTHGAMPGNDTTKLPLAKLTPRDCLF
jgi:hypothetical protein